MGGPQRPPGWSRRVQACAARVGALPFPACVCSPYKASTKWQWNQGPSHTRRAPAVMSWCPVTASPHGRAPGGGWSHRASPPGRGQHLVPAPPRGAHGQVMGWPRCTGGIMWAMSRNILESCGVLLHSPPHATAVYPPAPPLPRPRNKEPSGPEAAGWRVVPAQPGEESVAPGSRAPPGRRAAPRATPLLHSVLLAPLPDFK